MKHPANSRRRRFNRRRRKLASWHVKATLNNPAKLSSFRRPAVFN